YIQVGSRSIKVQSIVTFYWRDWVRGGAVNMYAVIETGGKQYRVEEGDVLFVEKLNVQEGENFDFDRVLMVSKNGELQAGKPYSEDAKVIGNVVEHGKGKKIVVFKYKSKKNYRKKQGHRQPYTKIKIEEIVG